VNITIDYGNMKFLQLYNYGSEKTIKHHIGIL